MLTGIHTPGEVHTDFIPRECHKAFIPLILILILILIHRTDNRQPIKEGLWINPK
ncbi:MAG: hypothetical protein OXU36_03455 [Candidatus Poribacteria bacterium]|nr:hypothetical protein [Candidatus Poribacteria bacterium]